MTTPKLVLPELSVSQASKEITHNQALAILDQITQARVLDKDLATPPGSPANGDAYIVAASPTGAWVGKTGQIAYWLTAVNAWSFAVPLNGWLVYVNDENKHYRLESGVWVELATGGGATLPVVQALTSTRNLSLADINTFNVNSTTNNYTVTIPPQSSVTWTADAEIHFLPSNTGDITITGGTGVSVNGVVAGSLTLSTQNGAASIKRIAADSWWVGGAIGTQAEQRTALGLGAGDSPSFTAISITTGPLAMVGNGRRITGEFSAGLGSLANRTIFQSVTANGQTLLTAMPNGTGTNSGLQAFANAADLENSARATFAVIGGSSVFVGSERTGSAAYLPLVLNTGGVDRLTISTAGTVTAPGVYASTTASAANVFVDSTGLLQRSTSSEQYKREIEPMAPEYAELAYQLEPIWYRSKCEGDNPEWSWWGFSAEQAATVDPRLVHWRTTEPVEVDGPIDEETGEPRKIIEHRLLATPVAEGFAYERLTVHHNALLAAHAGRIAALELALTSALERLVALEGPQ